MRRSRSVTLGLLASFAMTACNRRPTEMQRCVDQTNAVVDDEYCTAQGYPTGRYRWYYGGNGGYRLGTYASGGSYTPHAGFTATRSGSVSRGGFGNYMGHSGSSGGHGGSASAGS